MSSPLRQVLIDTTDAMLDKLLTLTNNFKNDFENATPAIYLQSAVQAATLLLGNIIIQSQPTHERATQLLSIMNAHLEDFFKTYYAKEKPSDQTPNP